MLQVKQANSVVEQLLANRPQIGVRIRSCFEAVLLMVSPFRCRRSGYSLKTKFAFCPFVQSSSAQAHGASFSAAVGAQPPMPAGTA